MGLRVIQLDIVGWTQAFSSSPINNSDQFKA